MWGLPPYLENLTACLSYKCLTQEAKEKRRACEDHQTQGDVSHVLKNNKYEIKIKCWETKRRQKVALQFKKLRERFVCISQSGSL